MNTWYAKTTNTGSPHEQGLVIDEATGANIAVSYDPKHVPILAAAPDLLAALRGLPDDIDMIEHNPEEGTAYFCCGASVTFGFHGRTGEHAPDCWYVTAREAIAKVGA